MKMLYHILEWVMLTQDFSIIIIKLFELDMCLFNLSSNYDKAYKLKFDKIQKFS